MENKMSHEQSLELIAKMINTSKANLKDNSIFFLLWGWLVLIAAISHYVLLQLSWHYAWLPWPVLMIGGSVASVIIGYRIGRRAKVMTWFDKTLMYFWYGFFFVVMAIIVMGGVGKLDWQQVQALIILLYGLGTFVSGGILKFKPLIIGGILAWIIGVMVFFADYQYTLILSAFSIIAAYLIPGYMLRKKENQNV